MRQKLFRSILLLTSLAVGLVLVLFCWLSYSYITHESYDSLKREAMLLIVAEPDGRIPVTHLQRLQLQDRVTLIAPDGHALYDNYADKSSMENHLEREEVREAMTQGEGRSQRASETLGRRVLYYAVALPDGNVLRMSRTNEAVFQQVKLLVFYFVLLAVLVLGGALFAARKITRRVLQPLEELNLEQPSAETVVYPELQPIVERFALQQKKLEREMRRYKSKKQELKALTNNMDEGMLFLNPEWEIASINKSALKYVGMDKQSVLGKRITDLDKSEEMHALLEQIELNGKGRLVVNRGSTYYQFNGSRIADKGFVLLMMDVTARTASEKLRREFSANVSHELKTPIALIQGYAEGLTAGVADDPEDRKFYCDTIADEADHMNKLVMQLLSLSRLELGAEQTFDEDIDLHALCAEAVRKTAVLCENRGLTVESENAHITVRTDGDLLDQVLMNYLSNAIRYTPEGKHIEISAARTGNSVRLSVFNEGEGLPEEELPKIWEKFYRTDRARTREAGGTGIGLSLVRAIADTLHGACGAENVEGGICFWFELSDLLPAEDSEIKN